MKRISKCLLNTSVVLFFASCASRNFAAYKAANINSEEKETKLNTFLSAIVSNPIPYATQIAEKSKENFQNQKLKLTDFNFSFPSNNVWKQEVFTEYSLLIKNGISAATKLTFCSSLHERCAKNSEHINQLKYFLDSMLQFEKKSEISYSEMILSAGWFLATAEYLHSLQNAFQPAESPNFIFEKYLAEINQDFLQNPDFMRPIVFTFGEYSIPDSLKLFASQIDIVGIPKFATSADGVYFTPFNFFTHDTEHASYRRTARLVAERVWNENSPKLNFANFDTFVSRNPHLKDAKVTKEQLAEQMQEDLNFIEFLINNMLKDTTATEKQKVSRELLLFLNSNEPVDCGKSSKVTAKISLVEGFENMFSTMKEKPYPIATSSCLWGMKRIVGFYAKSESDNSPKRSLFKLFSKKEKSVLSQVTEEDFEEAFRWFYKVSKKYTQSSTINSK